MPVAVEFSNPVWLLALPVVFVLLIAARLPWWQATRRYQATARRQARRQELLRFLARVAWVSLVVLALAGATVTRPLTRQAVIFVLDASASVAAARDQAEASARAGAESLRAGDLLGVIATAAGARIEEPPVAEPVFRRLAAEIPDSVSDIASGLRLAGALVPDGFVGRVVLVSDGQQTQGDALGAARELASRGVLVDALPLGASAGPDLLLEAVVLPDTAYQGEVSTLTARLRAGGPTAASLRVYRDDQLILDRRVDLRGARQEVVLPVPVGEPGLHRYRVDVAAEDPGQDSTAANNALGAIQRVVGPPRVLVVAAAPEAAGLLPAALQAGGAEVTVTAPSSIPGDLAGWARYEAVVLADVRAESLPPGAMDLLEAYVRDLGRGLVMTGGPDSYGLGGYADTPVERALPVYMDLRGRGRQPTVALALVIDKSGSMGGMKMELAKEAAARSVRLLRPDDQAAVVAFDSVPQWVAPLTPLTEQERIEQAIGSIYAAGGTEIYPALASGYAAVRNAESDVKHIILLTDGRSGSGGDYMALLREMGENRVTLSTVAVGSDADTGLLEAMARAGRGRYHLADDPSAIPEIFTKETLMATRTILVDGQFHPSAASFGPLLRGLSTVPPLDGYVAVTPKERAEVVLVSPEGDPVLAVWQYGLGRAIAWTSDVSGRWSASWAGSPATTTLWGNALSWLLPTQENGELVVRTTTERDGTLSLVAENRSGWDEVRATRAAMLGPEGDRREIELEPAGPGRYQANLGMPEPGAYVVQVTQVAPGETTLRGEVGWVAPYPAEYREAGVNQAFLTQLTTAGGGRLLDNAADAVSPSARQTVARWPAWPLLLVLAAIFWPIEIASRRLTIPNASKLLPLPSRRSPIAVDESMAPVQSTRPSRTAPDAPAASTTQRLLERKRVFREGQRDRTETGS